LGIWCLELLTTEAETPDVVHVNEGDAFDLDAESVALWSWEAR
jgi:hypothetical protein